MFDINVLKRDEGVIFALRTLYGKYGYRPYKMGKFEEYELYVRNKDFLVSDNVITFNDTNGRLLALKPDVTLSIIKNSKDIPGCTQKMYYNENVYRVSPRTHTFKEIMQTGLECIGDIDAYNIVEVIALAAESLAIISPEFVLDVSHMGILSAIIDESGADAMLKRKIVEYAAQKNIHDMRAECEANGISSEACDKLEKFMGIYGDMNTVTQMLEEICTDEKTKAFLDELKYIQSLLSETPYESNIHFDFSIANDMNYYNGIVFQGFVSGIPDVVLSGGQYDTLMKKMNKRSGAIGFAVFTDILEQLNDNSSKYDVDSLILYSDKTDKKELMRVVKMLTANGNRVTAQKAVPERLRYKQLLRLEERGLEIIENND